MNRCACGNYTRDVICHLCRSRSAWGAMWTLISKARFGQPDMQEIHAAFVAAAFLMQEPTRLRHEHQKELREEARDGQRGARDAYYEGRADGQRDEF